MGDDADSFNISRPKTFDAESISSPLNDTSLTTTLENQVKSLRNATISTTPSVFDTLTNHSLSTFHPVPTTAVAMNNSGIEIHEISGSHENVTEVTPFNSTWAPTSSTGEENELSLALILGLAIGSFTLVIIVCFILIAIYQRKKRKLPTGKLKMGARHSVQPEQYPGLFDDRDDIVSLSYINVHMPQPKRTKEEDIISLDSDGYLNSLENPIYDCHHPPAHTKPKHRPSSCTEM